MAVHKTIFQPACDWKSSWRDFSEFRGGSGGNFEGGLDFLEVALVWKYPHGTLPKQTSKKFASDPSPPQTSKKSLQKRFHAEACPAVLVEERNVSM